MRVVNKVEYTKYRQGLSIVHRNSPTYGRVGREASVTTARWKMRIGSALCLLLVASAARAQETPPQPVLRRVVLLPPPPPDATMQKWIAAARAAATQGPRSGGLLGLFAPKKSAALPAAAEPGKKKGGEKPALLPDATPEQLHALCATLFYEDLAAKLRTQRHLIVPTETEVRSALTTLHLTALSPQDADSARRLGQELDCDAVLIPELTPPERMEGATRSVTLRGTIHFVLLDPADRPGAVPSRKRRTYHQPALPPVFPFVGTAASGHTMFQEGYSRTAVQLATEAAQQAAAIASHTFWTGEVAPFAQGAERVALLPVPAPAAADALLFTTAGRRVASAAVRDLPTDLAAQFHPEIAPLSGKDVVSAEASRSLLKQEGITVEALWRQDQPETARVQVLGARLRVAYVLMAQITAVELQTGTPDAGQEFATREARAEAVGALVRVSDGVVLWQDHATATMTLRPTEADKPHSIDKQAVAQAEHFALTALQARFRAYRAHFENR
ncbi:MAG: hypothetical protein JWL77_2097 [Chthonomonadaceae bacterium]|nr:hypothetical protein [Chthonomonadaceae bacterium]